MIKGNIIAHYQNQSETKIEKIQSLEEHLFNVAYRGRHAATVIGQDDLLFFNWTISRCWESRSCFSG